MLGVCWRSCESYLIKAANEPVHMYSQVDCPAGCHHVTAPSQEAADSLQGVLEPAELHLLPSLQTHQSLVLVVSTDQGEHISQEGFSKQPRAGLLDQYLQQTACR